MRMILGCISYQHSALKRAWVREKEDSNRPLNVLGRLEKPPEEKEGFIYIIDETGLIQQSIRVWMPTGILLTETDMLIASPFSIHKVDRNLASIERHVYSMPWFNSLHSITHTQAGFLVTSTGLDLLLEFDQTGKILWSWWAEDHGFDVTPLGKQRYTNKLMDHRGSFYGTASHTTHINSAVELTNGDILASLFHQGMIIYIDRKSGEWKPLLERLDHPHSIRLQGEDSFTFADTGHGRALLIKMRSKKEASVEKEIPLETKWLQDCFYDKKRGLWWLLDAENTHVVTFHEKSSRYSRLPFDPELRLYSIEQM